MKNCCFHAFAVQDHYNDIPVQIICYEKVGLGTKKCAHYNDTEANSWRENKTLCARKKKKKHKNESIRAIAVYMTTITKGKEK